MRAPSILLVCRFQFMLHTCSTRLEYTEAQANVDHNSRDCARWKQPSSTEQSPLFSMLPCEAPRALQRAQCGSHPEQMETYSGWMHTLSAYAQQPVHLKKAHREEATTPDKSEDGRACACERNIIRAHFEEPHIHAVHSDSGLSMFTTCIKPKMAKLCLVLFDLGLDTSVRAGAAEYST